jgi:hypothetical protein
MDAIRRSNHAMSDCHRPFQSQCAELHPWAFVFLNEILDLREGMTAELQYSFSKNRCLLPNRGANPRPHRGAIQQSRVHARFAHPLYCLHQKYVHLQDGIIAALLLVGTPLVSLLSAPLNDRLPAPGVLAPVQQHRTGSAAFRLRSFLLNANHHFGGQL